MPEILVLALGGTIAMAGEEGVSPRLTGQELVEAVPDLAHLADLVVETFRQVPGAHLALPDVVDLAVRVEEALDAGTTGVVITQGTDTIEETAYALDLLLERRAPVVMTGALRHPAQPGADGPANLLNAVRIATGPGAAGLGVLVTFDDRIHAARWVAKRHPGRPSAFKSPGTGPIGWISEGAVRLTTRPSTPAVRLSPADLTDRDPARVALLRAALGDDGRLVEAVGELGYQGLVYEGFGAGHVPGWMVDRLESLASRMPVVLASRTGSGSVFRDTYGFPGSETDLLSRGLLWGGALDGLKARILLTLALTAGWDRDRITTALADA